MARDEERASWSAGSRIVGSISLPAPTVASTITGSLATRIATGGCAASIAKRLSIPAPIRPIRFQHASKRRRSRAFCRARTISPHIAAGPSRSPQTNVQFCPTAGSRGRASASRLNWSSMRSQGKRASSPMRSARRTSPSPSRCRTRTSQKRLSTAGTIRNRCAERWRRSIFPRCARGNSGARRTVASSASAWPHIASKLPTAPQSITAGRAYRWCRASSRRRRG